MQARTHSEREHRMWLTDHIQHMPDHFLSKMAMRWIPPRGKTKRGRPYKILCRSVGFSQIGFLEQVCRDLIALSVHFSHPNTFIC